MQEFYVCQQSGKSPQCVKVKAGMGDGAWLIQAALHIRVERLVRKCVRLYGQHLFNCQLSVECAGETNTLPAVR